MLLIDLDPDTFISVIIMAFFMGVFVGLVTGMIISSKGRSDGD